MKRPVALALALALTLACGGCFGARKHRDPSVLQITKLTGAASVRGADGAWKAAATGTRIGPDGGIRVVQGADVLLARGDTSSVELRGTDGTGEIVVGATAGDISVRSGDVLVHSDPSAPMSVGSGTTSARGHAAIFRFDRRLRLRIGSYDGDVDVSVEKTVALPSLAPLDEWLVNPRIAPVRRAYSLDTNDPWDRRLLADAVEIEEASRPLQDGYDARYGIRTAHVSDLDALAQDAGEGLDFAVASLSRTRSSDVLMGIVYALLLEHAGRGSAGGLYAQLIARRAQGAVWGLIAHERALAPNDVLSALTCAISLRTGEVKPGERCFAPASRPSPSPGSSRPAPRGGSGGPSPRPSHSPRPTSSATPTPTHSPSPTPTPTATPTCSVVDSLLNGGSCP